MCEGLEGRGRWGGDILIYILASIISGGGEREMNERRV